MVTNQNFSNEYGYFDTIFIYAGNTFLLPLFCVGNDFKAAHALIQPSSTASLVQNPQITVRPYM